MHKELSTTIRNIACPEFLPTKSDAAGFLNDLLHSQRFISQPITMELPVTSGVYGLFDKNELVYLGQSSGIAHRVQTHLQDPRRIFDSVGFVLVPVEYREVVERRMIQALKPKYNRKHIKRKSWGRVIIDDLAAVLNVPPGIIRAVCEANGLMEESRTVEIREVLFHLARSRKDIFFT